MSEASKQSTVDYDDLTSSGISNSPLIVSEAHHPDGSFKAKSHLRRLRTQRNREFEEWRALGMERGWANGKTVEAHERFLASARKVSEEEMRT
jgi:hypothetical protein